MPLFLTCRNVSRSVWIWNVPGVSAVLETRKDSRGEMASEVAERRPILSQRRNLGGPCQCGGEGSGGRGDTHFP